MQQSDILARMAGVLVLLIAAAAYMRLGLFVPINWSDEGIIVYPIWRVAMGEIPYRDFHHLYGPSVFFLNGFLLRIFGLDLAVIRYALLGAKVLLCGMVYLAARGVSGRVFALIAFATAVVMSGLVWPISTIPYPSTFGSVLCLGGLLAFLAAGRRVLAGCVIAGLCFGLATTFKQTTGAFAFLGLALFLLFPAEAQGEAQGERDRRGLLLGFVATSSRWFVLVFAAILSAFYLIPRNPLWNLVWLGGPVAVLLAHLAWREWQHPPSPEGRVRSFWSLVALSLAFLVPPLAYASYFVSLGLGSELLFDTAVGLPGVIDWVSPFATPGWTFVLWQTGCLGAFGGAALWHRRSTGQTLDGRSLTALSIMVCSLASLGVLAFWGWSQREESWWFWSTSDLLLSMPFVLVVSALLSLIRRDREHVRAGEGASESDRAFRLWTCHATLGLMWLFPSADIWHFILVLPSFLPLLAWLLERFWRLPAAAEDGTDRVWRPLAAGLIGALCLVLMVPAIHDVLAERARVPAYARSLPRATGINGGSDLLAPSAGQLVRYLVDAEHREESLLVLSGKPLFYFLADRVSPLQQYEFAFYLAGIDGIPPERARELADENEMIRRLRSARPLILDDVYDSAGKNIREAFPALARFIRSHYRPEKAIGGFRLLRWRSDSGGS